MTDCVLLLPQVEVRGCDRGHNGYPPFPLPQGRRPRREPQPGDHRLPERQDLAPRRPVLQGDRREQEGEGQEGARGGRRARPPASGLRPRGQRPRQQRGGGDHRFVRRERGRALTTGSV